MGEKVVVVGLGRFGSALTNSLSGLGYDVLAVDKRSDRVREFANDKLQIVQGDGTSKALWDDLQLRDYGIGVVAFASQTESSILTCLLLKRMGVKTVIAKSNGSLHGEVLRAIGVDHVVEPEEEAGARLAHVLGTRIEQYIPVAREFGVAMVTASPELVNKSCAELESKQGCTVLVIRRSSKVIVTPSGKEEIQPEDRLVVAAKDFVLRRIGA